MRIEKLKENTIQKNGNAFLPQNAIFYVTYKCNLNCSYCFQRKQYEDNIDTYRELSTDEIQKCFKNLNLKTLFLTGGEIFLRKDIRDLICFFSKRVKRLSLFTNGTMLKQEDADLIQSLDNVDMWFSVDGIDSANDSNRGEGTFSKIMQNVKKIKNNKIYFNTVINSKNIDELDSFYQFANEMNVEQITFQFPMWYKECCDFQQKYGFDYYPGMQGQYDLQFIRKLKDQIVKLTKHDHFKTKCRFISPIFVENIEDYISGTIRENHDLICADIIEPKLKILPNGDVVICEAFKTQIGNLIDNTLEEIWNNTSACKIRKTLCNYNLTEMCSRCCSINYISGGIDKIENTK